MELAHFVNVATVCAAEAEGLLEKPRSRRYAVHPYNNERSRKCPKFLEDIRKHPDKFFEYYRMSIASFDELLGALRPLITKQETSFKKPISAKERLTVTLRYLATGNTFTALQYEFHIGRSTIADIVSETCQAIWLALKDTEMPEPTKEEWYQIADTFQEKTDFPNCLGAVDGKHIRCVKPRSSGSKFFNYKKYFSVVLMAVANANLRFISIDVGAYGEEGDSTVFRDSTFGTKLYSGQLNIPAPKCLPGTDSTPQPFVFPGDEAFKIHTNLMRPFPARDIDGRRRIFNYRLSRARRSVECAFGLLANKWRIFHTPILVRPELIDDIVKACCILHNFVRQRDGANYEEGEISPFPDVINTGAAPRDQGTQVRDFFADYFVGIGAVPFQEEYNY
ncbi:unnamed protein product [Acanthoscelides obtectus]|uniref:DDE Tnp4 domain-containing protein n=1 Tax=Acanthoscelides obtectus TaxID=200917 RepID=A0A9P0LT15_ACAOB|nr:unnamed protein product [Acanthoscelides obtectus]CAK1627035.1 Protein ALP1-like [Acanthoscelides obtectus]